MNRHNAHVKIQIIIYMIAHKATPTGAQWLSAHTVQIAIKYRGANYRIVRGRMIMSFIQCDWLMHFIAIRVIAEVPIRAIVEWSH